MRVLSIACVLVLLGCAAASASAAGDASSGCFARGDGPPPLGDGYRAGLTVLSPSMGAGGVVSGGQASEAKLSGLLGAQYGGAWAEAWLDGWGVGLAPGPLDAAAARTLIEEHLLNDLPPALAAAAKAGLRIGTETYSWADLQAAQQQVTALLATPDPPRMGAYGIGCTVTGVFRVEVTIWDPTSAADEVRLRDLLAPLGDKVVITREAGPGAVPAVGSAPGGPVPPPAGPAAVPSSPSAAVVERRAVRAGTRLRLRVSCPEVAKAPCAGTVSVRLRGRGGASRSLGRLAFTGLRPGMTRTLALPLTRAQRAALAGGRSPAVIATVRTGAKTGAARRLQLR